jgi:hypothetical protein
MTLMVKVPANAQKPRGNVPLPMAAQPAPDDVQVLPHGTAMNEAVNSDDLCLFCGLCCVIGSCYTKWPECLGCANKGVLMCLEIEGAACKTGRTEGSLCVCLKGESEVIKPVTCIKCTQQLCCVDLRCALPFDAEVPCVVGFAGVQCVKEYKCACVCAPKLTGKAPGGAAPVPEEMCR